MANYLQTDATVVVKNSAGKLKGIMVTAASSTPTITVYDASVVATSRPIMKVFTPTASTQYYFGTDGIFFTNGLYIVISGTVSATVIYE
jgi:hypothetical protein